MSFHFSSLSVLLKGAVGTFKRFPLSLLATILATGIGIYLLEMKWEEQKESVYLYKVIMCCWLGLNLFLALSLFSERKIHSMVTKYILQAIALALLVGYYFMLPDFKRITIADGTRYVLFSVGLHLFVSFASFIGRGEINGFWQFNKNLFLRFLLSTLYAGVLYMGLALALLAIDQLFNVNIKGERYIELWITLAGVFNTWFFLSGVPSNFEGLEVNTEYPKGLKIFTQYVLLPLVALYLFILYAYSIKILIQWELPKGWVSYLVNAFSVFGILSLLLIFPIRNDEENKWMNIFSRWFYRALFPLIVLLGVAISTRVMQYGITENRYFVLIVALWLTGMAIYFLLSKAKNIKVIPVSLCLIAFLSSFGPWGAFSVAERSQVNRLEKLLIKENILVNGKVEKAKDTVSVESQRQIVAIIHYLDDHHHFNSIKPWFKEDLDTVLKPKEPNGTIYEEGKILDLMGVKENFSRYVYDEGDGARVEENFNFNVEYINSGVITVSGFDYSCNVSERFVNENYNVVSAEEASYLIGKDSISISNEKNANQYLLLKNNKEVLNLKLLDFVKKIDAYNRANKKTEYDSELPASQMVIDVENEVYKIKLFVSNISGTKSDDKMYITDMNGTLLVKMMQGSDMINQEKK